MNSDAEIANILLGHFPLNYNGTLVEVGAAHPLHVSHSFWFRPLSVQKKIWNFYFEHSVPLNAPNSAWEIISIEPIPEFCKEFRKNNLEVLQYACTSTDIGRTTFKVSPAPMCSSAIETRMNGYEESEYKTINIAALTLNTILQKHYPQIKNIDILIIDAEGWGMEVLRGIDLKKYNPLLVLVEVIGSPESPDNYIDYMVTKGYVYEKDVSPNMLFKQKN